MLFKDCKVGMKVYYKSKSGKKRNGKIVQVLADEINIRFNPKEVDNILELHNANNFSRKRDCRYFYTYSGQDHDQDIRNIYKLRTKPLTYGDVMKKLKEMGNV